MTEMNCFMVGGCVRDKLMGIKPNDVDFVVIGSNPEFMVNNGFRQVGADFPVFLDENGDEYALARTERKTGRGYTGFETFFGEDVTLEQDLARRDLTVNAIAQDPETEEVFDPFNGAEDIDNKILRHVSTAFAEDPVRVLRIARFHARFGSEWKIAQETKILISQMIDSGALDELTPERVWKEIEKAMTTDSPWLFFDTLFDLGALNIISPELATIDLEHIEAILKHAPSNDAEINFAKVAALIPSPNDTDDMMAKLKLSNSLKKLITLRRTLGWVQFLHESPERSLQLMTVVSILDQSAMTEDWINRALHGVASNFLDRVVDSFHAIKAVNFTCLSEEQNTTLKGAEIGIALKQMRIENIKEFWKRV